MDLGIAGRKAIVCASTRGLGHACAAALSREGVHVVVNGRDAERVRAACDALEPDAAASVTGVAADLGTQAGRDALIAACPDADILVNNNDGPPPGAFDGWGEDEWSAALEANLLAPTFLIRSLLPGMKARGFGRIVNITSAMVKTPHPAMGLSTAARTGLTALCKGLAREAAPFGVTINNLLPERFDTDRQAYMARVVMQLKGIDEAAARAEQVASIPAGRLGRPEEFGDACAFLCSANAGFISGQNLQLDGAAYAGLI